MRRYDNYQRRERCKDCKWYYRGLYQSVCRWMSGRWERVNPGYFACKKFVYKYK